MNDKSLDTDTIRQIVSETLKLELTDAELEALTTGDTPTLEHLVQDRDLSVGIALIQSDASQPEQETDLIETGSGDRKIQKEVCIPTPKGTVCINVS